MHDNYLMHWGIKGMKWGVRRYQNSDGTYTELGKRRRREDNYHEDYKRAHNNKPITQMSDKELADRNRRLNMEKNYKDLTRKRNKGMEYAKAFIKGAGTLSALVSAYGMYKKNGKLIVTGLMRKMPEVVVDFGNFFTEPNNMAWDYNWPDSKR